MLNICSFSFSFINCVYYPGQSNNHMLKLFMDLKGKIPHKIVRKGQCKDQHFDVNCCFLYRDIDKVTQREKVISMATVNKTRNLETELTGLFLQNLLILILNSI